MNPARELASLLETLHRSERSKYPGMNGYMSDWEKLETLGYGIQLLTQLHSFLDAENPDCETFEPFSSGLNDVRDTVISLINGFDNNTTPESIRYLRMFSAALEKQGKLEIRQDAENVRGMLKEFTSIVDDSGEIPDDLREYCRVVIAKVEEQLRRFEKSKSFDLQDAVDKMLSATSYLLRSYVTSKSPWGERVKKFWITLVQAGQFSGQAHELGHTVQLALES